MRPSLIAAVYALGWVPLFVFRVEAVRASLPHYDRRERAAVRLTPIVLSVHVTLACLRLDIEPAAAPVRFLLGASLWVSALLLWFSGRVRIGPPSQRRLPGEPPLAFRRDGAFALVRHPLYASYLLAALAPVVVTMSPLLLLTFLASFVAISVRARQEESRLRSQLGASYDAYCRDVKGLIPFLW